MRDAIPFTAPDAVIGVMIQHESENRNKQNQTREKKNV